MIKEALLGLGLTSNETEIYLVLLNWGELSVNEIGSKSGLHRQVCYDALDRLVEKGFISFLINNNKKSFRALHPQKIIDYLEEKKNEIGVKKSEMIQILPDLTTLFNLHQEETQIELIKGKNVMRTIYNDIIKTLLEKKETLFALGIDERKFLEYDRIAIKQYLTTLKRNKLKEKLLSKEMIPKGINKEIKARTLNIPEMMGKSIISLSFFKTAKLCFTSSQLRDKC